MSDDVRTEAAREALTKPQPAGWEAAFKQATGLATAPLRQAAAPITGAYQAPVQGAPKVAAAVGGRAAVGLIEAYQRIERIGKQITNPLFDLPTPYDSASQMIEDTTMSALDVTLGGLASRMGKPNSSNVLSMSGGGDDISGFIKRRQDLLRQAGKTGYTPEIKAELADLRTKIGKNEPKKGLAIDPVKNQGFKNKVEQVDADRQRKLIPHAHAILAQLKKEAAPPKKKYMKADDGIPKVEKLNGPDIEQLLSDRINEVTIKLQNHEGTYKSRLVLMDELKDLKGNLMLAIKQRNK